MGSCIVHLGRRTADVDNVSTVRNDVGLEKQIGEQKVANVICSKLHLNAVRSLGVWAGHNGSIVDETINFHVELLHLLDCLPDRFLVIEFKLDEGCLYSRTSSGYVVNDGLDLRF